MDSLDGLKTVIAVVETGSFTTASERLMISKALVSKYVGEVEDKLGVRLFNRTTRRLALTDAGKTYYERALPLVEEYEELLDSVTGEQSAPKGKLKISVPVTFGEMQLSPVINKFLTTYSDIQVNIQLTDRRIDMLEEGVDVVIRIGGVDDSNMVARQINTYPLILCASPAYLNQHGYPKTPNDITSHSCIVDSNFRIGKQWPLVSPNGTVESIEVTSRIAANSPRAVMEIAKSGGGIALIPEFIVQDTLAQGLLLEVLPGYTTLEFGLFAIFPHRRYLSKKIRCFIDFMIDEFSSSAK
ncbi:LysR family transcriptional regulator [Shewanella sp. SG41-4]|uniref:LysR family transcriptional regulator n=1 Tax=Shewanella sp. SG41-4 TaxID=2760976 RepID=UPI001602C8FF|nr:LysR family transcriptional regulator [Shewanella sp. SG41-4]MBB1440045.1 LysR family transcriptional regulator [Shewanella sp. SG41-4]